MKYKVIIWVDEESSDFIINNIDVVEAGLNFFFWDRYEYDIKELSIKLNYTDQYGDKINVRELIEAFRRDNKVKKGIIDIIIVSKDIYFNGKEYIFAATHVPSKTIVISLYRLLRKYSLKEYDNISIVRKRVFKEILHEIGHMLGLDHCSDKKCVMSFSPDLKSLDNKLPFFCSSCVNKLKMLGYDVLDVSSNV